MNKLNRSGANTRPFGTRGYSRITGQYRRRNRKFRPTSEGLGRVKSDRDRLQGSCHQLVGCGGEERGALGNHWWRQVGGDQDPCGPSLPALDHHRRKKVLALCRERRDPSPIRGRAPSAAHRGGETNFFANFAVSIGRLFPSPLLTGGRPICLVGRLFRPAPTPLEGVN
jgi:hypothetical protein